MLSARARVGGSDAPPGPIEVEKTVTLQLDFHKRAYRANAPVWPTEMRRHARADTRPEEMRCPQLCHIRELRYLY
jgi:hypothetical protein